MPNDDHRCHTSLEMVETLRERQYTPEMIAAEMNTSLKRVQALISELERRRSQAA